MAYQQIVAMAKAPKHAQEKLVELYKDCDGWWAVLKKGYHFVSTECHTERTDTWTEMRKCLVKKNIVAVEDDWEWDE